MSPKTQARRLREEADRLAILNGTSPDRSLESYRFASGMILGLRMAADMIEEWNETEQEDIE